MIFSYDFKSINSDKNALADASLLAVMFYY